MNNSDLYICGKKYDEAGDLSEAYHYYLEAALSENDGNACEALGNMYYAGDYVHQDYDKAGHYFAMAFDSGIKVDRWTLIIAADYWKKRYKESREEVNLHNAIKCYEIAGLRGEVYGYECLGEIYIDLGDYDKAYEYLTKKEIKNTCGFYQLGRMYEEGLGVNQNLNKAIELYKRTVEMYEPYEEEYGPDGYAEYAKDRLRKIGIM